MFAEKPTRKACLQSVAFWSYLLEIETGRLCHSSLHTGSFFGQHGGAYQIGVQTSFVDRRRA
jgi:hypothetical protein